VPTFESLTGRLLDHELRSADSTVLFTSTRRAQAINDGLLEFAALTDCFLRVSTIAVSCNTQTYNLLSSGVMSTDFIRIAARQPEFHLRSSGGGSSARLTQIAGDDFPRRDIEWLNTYVPGWRSSTTPGMPTSWYLDESDGRVLLGLDVPPDVGSSETATLVVPYVARPAPMTSTSDVPYTTSTNVRRDLEPFHQGLVHYAAHQLEKLRGDDQASDRQLAKFQAYVDRFRAKARHTGANMVRFAVNYLQAAQRQGRGRGTGTTDDYARWP
jgi:hypothetical protein